MVVIATEEVPKDQIVVGSLTPENNYDTKYTKMTEEGEAFDAKTSGLMV